LLRALKRAVFGGKKSVRADALLADWYGAGSPGLWLRSAGVMAFTMFAAEFRRG